MEKENLIGLQDEEKKIQGLLDNIPGVFYLRANDQQLTIKYFTDEIENLTGYPPSDFIDHNVISYESLIHPEDRAEVKKHIQDAISAKKTVDFEYRLCHKDGSVRWVHERSFGTFDGDILIHLNGIIMDITRRRRAEERVRQHLEFEKLLSDAPGNILDPKQGYEDKGIQRCVEVVGKRFKLECSYVVVFSDSKKQKGQFFKWHSEEASKQQGTDVSISPNDMPWLEEQFQSQKHVLIPDIDALSGTKGIDKEQLSRRGIKSLLCVPITIENEISGFFALVSLTEKRTWTKSELSFIDIFGRIIAHGIEGKRAERRLKYLTYHDELTGLYNRTFFEAEVRRLNVARQLPISLILLDVNGLKLVNDAFGHRQGDALLTKTAEIIGESCRDEDICVRWGGDEFIILLPQTNQERAVKICARIQELCEETKDDPFPVSVATGYATKKDASEDMDVVYKKAEEQMYKTKLMEGNSARGAVLGGLLGVLGANSHETEEHALRLKKMVRAVGKRLSLAPPEMDKLALLASLHDIGKASIPKEILLKSEPLTDEEWNLIKTHAVRGYRIASSIKEIAHVADLICCHHEWWDGSGYPEGLKGEDIPLLSRLTSIADAYDVMTVERAYVKPVSPKTAFDELRRCAGTQFDPSLVDVFIEVMEQKLGKSGEKTGVAGRKLTKNRRSVERIYCENAGVYMAYETSFSLPQLGRGKHGKKAPPLPVKDFSKHGICFLSKENLKPDKEIQIYLKIGRNRPPQTLKAQVRNVRKGSGQYPYVIGARFTSMSRGTWSILSRIKQREKDTKKGKTADPFAETKTALIRKERNIIAQWEGGKSQWIKNLNLTRPWRLLWAAEGGALSFLTISIYKEGASDRPERPVNEHNINGVAEGHTDIRQTGRLMLKVETGKSYPAKWLIVLQDTGEPPPAEGSSQ